MEIDEILKEKGEEYGRPDMFMGQLAQVWGAMLGKHLSSTQVTAMMMAKIAMDILKDDENWA